MKVEKERALTQGAPSSEKKTIIGSRNFKGFKHNAFYKESAEPPSKKGEIERGIFSDVRSPIWRGEYRGRLQKEDGLSHGATSQLWWAPEAGDEITM